MGFPSGSAVEESTCNARDTGSIPGWEKFPGGRHANPLQYSCLENPVDREACWATVHRVTKSWIRLKQLSTCTCIVGNSVSQILIYDIIKRKVAPPTVETVNYYELVIHKMSDTSRVAVFPLILKNISWCCSEFPAARHGALMQTQNQKIMVRLAYKDVQKLIEP